MPPPSPRRQESRPRPRIRVGIVGCGEVTQIIHLPTLAQLADDFEVTALCDVSATVLRAVGDAWGVEARVRDVDALVARPDVDAVLVANPHAFHTDATLRAIERGKHVLVEKPMALTLAQADAVIEAQRGSGLVVQVGYMRRYAPAFVEAVRRMRELEPVRLARVHDLIGRNAMIVAQVARVATGDDVPREAAVAARDLQARLVAEAIGPAPQKLRKAYLRLLGLSTHDVSAMRELLGRPEGLLYAAERHGGAYLTAAFDYGSFVCHFETGVDSVPRFDAHIEVFGSRGSLRLQYDTPYVRNLPTRLSVARASGRGGVVQETVLPSWGDPFVAEWRAFAENVRRGREPKTSPADFREDLELLLAMVAAMRKPGDGQ